MVMIKRVVVVDGYTDEPAGLGVPPYINVYPRLIAGALWLVDKSIEVYYYTIDSVRESLSRFLEKARRSDLVVFIAGAEVPGRYIGGKPLSFNELEYFSFLLRDQFKVLVGPAARFGFGRGGGTIAVDRSRLKKLFQEIVSGDPEIYFYSIASEGLERAEPWRLRSDYELADQAFIKGSKIILQHPNYGWNLVVEIETYRGCPRWITGGCSFCIEPRYGRPLMRRLENIVREIETLYRFGARHFRLGRQPDILVYMSPEIGDREFPRPVPSILEKLFHGIRYVAPGLRTLHIDNVNPGTIVHNREEALKALKVIVKYHTPGDVAALGIESFDEKVVKMNNLKVYPDEALQAIRLINRIGSHRGWNGLPHLLPGINLLHGLLGESRETFYVNLEYLKKIWDEGLIIRRINVRKVSILENTPLWIKRSSIEKLLRRHSRFYQWYRSRVMDEFDRRFLNRVVSHGMVLRYLYTEKHVGEFTIARQPASYPLVVKIHGIHSLKKIVDVRVKNVSAKSVLAEHII